MFQRAMAAWLLAALAGAAQMAAAAEGTATVPDERLRRAEEFVARSDRYLHHAKLREGMSGYGLTVMAGTKIEKFDAVVLSVMKNYSPRQDVILCRLSGLGLEKGGLVAGMSGSPIYIKDPADGKDKLIGAVAYGWSFQKEPVCGVQPITQMLAVEGVPLPGVKAPETQPATAEAASAAASAGLDEEFVRLMLRPEKADFLALTAPKPSNRIAAANAGESSLAPLPLPVMVSGPGKRVLELAEKALPQLGMIPVQAGAAGEAATRLAGEKLRPGSVIAIPLAAGDAAYTAVGTVTEVIGDYVLAFGHPFQAEGTVDLPMGPGYVHTVVNSLGRSFKLASSLEVTGALTTDEMTGIGGRVGPKADWIPLVVHVRRGPVRQQFRYKLIHHRRATAALSGMMLEDSVLANRNLPENHTLDYAVDVDFGELGKFHVENRSSANDLQDVASDLVRPVLAMMNSPLGRPGVPRSIEVSVTVSPVRKTATIQTLKLQQNRYQPGETVRGEAILQPFRAERTSAAVSIPLPEDLREGRYVLTACDAAGALDAMRQEMPHRFTPKTERQLLEAIGRTVELKTDRIYLRLPLPAVGVAVQKDELERVPASVAEILVRTAPVDANLFRTSKVAEFPVEYVLMGEARAEIVVERYPKRE